MELKVLKINTPIEDFMNSETFEREINAPARKYYKQVYSICAKTLTIKQRELFDAWWDGKPIPSDECYWKNTAVPKGYEKFIPEDIKIAHDAVLSACSMGCG